MTVSGRRADDEAAARLTPGVVAYALDVLEARLIGNGGARPRSRSRGKWRCISAMLALS